LMRLSPEQKAKRQQQLEEILRIRIDGAQSPWDVRDYVRERESGAEAAEPWKLEKGQPPLTDAQIAKLVTNADALILKAAHDDLDVLVARQVMQRRALYARAVNNGELTVALACIRDEAKLLGLDGAASKKPKAEGERPAMSNQQRVEELLQQGKDAYDRWEQKAIEDNDNARTTTDANAPESSAGEPGAPPAEPG
jgi:hypothetical protein